jgi:cytochrome b subunit of formate dehydrogenase
VFPAVAITGFIIVLTIIILHCVVSRPKLDDLFGKERRWNFLDVLRVAIYLLTLLLLEQKLDIIGILRKLVYLLALLCFLVLLVTGFVPLLILRESISGCWLMIHTTAAGVFAVCLAVLAVMWAHNCRFNKSDWPWLQKILRREPVATAGQKYQLVRKIAFWLIVFLALPLILSIVSSMFVFFGTDGQEFLLSTHRYSALAFALVAIVHTYLMALSQAKKQ